MALTDEELNEILEGFDGIVEKAKEVAEELPKIKRKLKKEEKDVEE